MMGVEVVADYEIWEFCQKLKGRIEVWGQVSGFGVDVEVHLI